jgi:hypothetical protein
MIPYNLKINGVEEDGATSIADINSDGILDVDCIFSKSKQ